MISSLVLIKPFNVDSQITEDDSCKVLFLGEPQFDIPLFILPVSRLDLMIPTSKSDVFPPFPSIGGDFGFLTFGRVKTGIYGGFSINKLHERSFNGNYLQSAQDKYFRVNLKTNIINVRFGVKFFDHTSIKRVKPYTELYFSHFTIRTRLSNYEEFDNEDEENENEPNSEFRIFMRETTPSLFANFGLEFNLLSNQKIKDKDYKGKGCFLSIGIGGIYAFRTIEFLDLRYATVEKDDIQDSEMKFKKYGSHLNSFSVFIPTIESTIRFLNCSIGLSLRF
jgi:hypothetical protein